MKRWKLPKIFGIQSASEYFLAVCELNQGSKTFSQRELAKFLAWPMSYVPDVIKCRKPLTVGRALEFIKAFKFHPVDAEHLIFMAVSSQTKTDHQTLQDLRQIKSPELRKDHFPDLTVFDFEAMLTCQAISVLEPKASIERVAFLLKTRDISPVRMAACLELLLSRKMIRKTKSGFAANFEKAYSTIDMQMIEMRKLQQSFLKSTQRFFDAPFKPGTGSSGFVMINRDRYEEVRGRIQTLKNWILEVSTVDSASEQAENLLMQYDLHLLPVFNPDALQAAREGRLTS